MYAFVNIYQTVYSNCVCILLYVNYFPIKLTFKNIALPPKNKQTKNKFQRPDYLRMDLEPFLHSHIAVLFGRKSCLPIDEEIRSQ